MAKEDDETYLAFIKGTRDVSNYFQKFIGSTDLTSSKANVNNVKTALNKYMEEKKFSEEKKAIVFSDVYDYMKKQYDNKEDINLASISAIISPKKPNDFNEFVHLNGLEVSGSFPISRKSDIDIYRKAKVVETGYKLEFERNLLRKKIFREGNNIVIKDVSKEILDVEFGETS